MKAFFEILKILVTVVLFLLGQAYIVNRSNNDEKDLMKRTLTILETKINAVENQQLAIEKQAEKIAEHDGKISVLESKLESQEKLNDRILKKIDDLPSALRGELRSMVGQEQLNRLMMEDVKKK